MSSTEVRVSGGARGPLVRDADEERRRLLLCIAVTAPYDAAELSIRLGRPKAAVHEDLNALMSDGIVHLHEGALRTAAASRVVAAAAAEELHDIFAQMLAETASGATVPPASLVALAEAGCSDATLLGLLVRAAGDHPDDASVIQALAAVARARGEDAVTLQLLRAEDAAAQGRAQSVLMLTEELLTGEATPTRLQAAMLAAGAHIQGGRLDRAAALHEHVGADAIGIDAVWAVVAAIGRGDLAAARRWRAAMGDASITSRDAGFTDFADGLLASIDATGEDALDLLVQAVTTLSPLGADVVLPETPAAAAALVAISRGEPDTAEGILERVLKSGLGGESGRRRHVLLSAWALMVQGQMDAAEARLGRLGETDELGERDLLLLWSLRAGIARRRTDLPAMKAAWHEIRGLTFGLRVSLYDLLPLGEMMIVAARLRDATRTAQLLERAEEVLTGLGSPATWAAPLHWHGIQAAFQSDDPAALIPHANALVQAGRVSPYAATLAAAGQTWLEVLRGETDFPTVEASARALARTGHVWDAARLAGQAALQHPERECALSMMQLAREISRGHERQAVATAAASSTLTGREIEVARLVLDGQGYRAIGAQLFISPKTVEHHVARIRSRIGASSRGELLEKLHDIVAAHDR